MTGAPPALHREVAGDGPTVVLVHGFTQTGRSWSRVVPALADRYRVVTVDAPGHGGSTGVTADLRSGARLLGRAGGDGAYVGYSMGGRLALHLALEEPARVRALVLLGATAGIDDAGERAERRRDDEGLARRIEEDGVDRFLDRWLAQPLFAGLPDDPADRADRRRNTATGLAASLRRAGTGTQDPPLWDRLPGLRMPVLLVAGERDAKFRALAERMSAGIGDHATVAVVPGAGHAAHLEAPDAFVDAIAPFLAAHHPPTGR